MDGVLCAKLKTKKTQNLSPLFADRFLEVRGSKIANGNQNSSLKNVISGWGKNSEKGRMISNFSNRRKTELGAFLGPLRSFSLPDKVWIGADSVHALVTKPQSNTKETSFETITQRTYIAENLRSSFAKIS